MLLAFAQNLPGLPVPGTQAAPIDLTWSITSLALYYVVTLLVGLACVVLGYRLFAHGLEARPGRAEAGVGKYKLVFESAAPGTFFALFGAVIVVVGLWRGPELNQSVTYTVGAATAIEKQRADTAQSLQVAYLQAFRPAAPATPPPADPGATEKRLDKVEERVKVLDQLVTKLLDQVLRVLDPKSEPKKS